MRSIWSGALNFGLINIPVQLYSGTFDRGINFDMLHEKDLSPIRFAKVCKQEEKEVPYNEIVKGYEYTKGEYVVITEEDFQRVSPKRTKMIDIQCFVNEDEIDTLYYEKPYLLEPGKGAAKAYLLLNEALKKSKKVGVSLFVLHKKEHLALIKPHGRGLILNQLRFKSELRPFEEIELSVAKIQPKEVEVAVKLIDQLTEPFKPENFKDTYTDEIKAMIEEKTKGKKPRRKKEEIETAPTKDIMKQLQESLQRYRPPGKASRARLGMKHR